MTNEEAIKFFQDFLDLMKQHNETDILNNQYCKASRTAIKALEKQIPAKPNIKLYDDVDEQTNKSFTWIFYTCPVCSEHIGARGNHYCSHCGQALDWGNKDDV